MPTYTLLLAALPATAQSTARLPAPSVAGGRFSWSLNEEDDHEDDDDEDNDRADDDDYDDDET